MRHQPTVVLLDISEHVHHGIIDRVRCAVVDIHEICLLDCGDDLLYEGFLDS